MHSEGAYCLAERNEHNVQVATNRHDMIVNERRTYAPDFFSLAEPPTSMTRIPASYWNSISMVLLGVDDRGQSFSNIGCFTTINILSPIVCSSSSQHLFVQFLVGNMMQGNVFIVVTTVVEHGSLLSSIDQISVNRVFGCTVSIW